MSDVTEQETPVVTGASITEHRGGIERYEVEDREWYQENLDIVFPLMIIGLGAFQYILRKWIMPISDDLMRKIENELPSQALRYNPLAGVALMILGVILLFLFNIYKLF